MVDNGWFCEFVIAANCGCTGCTIIEMSYPSQVCMSELQPFMTPAFLINAFQKLGHHPVSATMTKKRKGDDKDVCIVQFANEDAAKQAVFKLNGKLVPSTGYTCAAKFKLSQCIGNRPTEHNVWVGDLSADVDDYHFFKFFSTHYKSLCNAKVILDTRGVSRGYGFLRFSNEEEQKHCLKNMGGSLGLGCRPIRVGPVTKGHNASFGSYTSDTVEIFDDENTCTENKKSKSDDEPWQIYTSWNQFTDPSEYKFSAIKLKYSLTKEDVDPMQDLRLVDYNISLNVDDLNKEILEQDCYLWDALECTSWLPERTLGTTINSKN